MIKLIKGCFTEWRKVTYMMHTTCRKHRMNLKILQAKKIDCKLLYGLIKKALRKFE
jgi:hypothetical protein